MFRNTYQKGFLSVFKPGGSKPLSIWDCESPNGSIRTLTDEDIGSLALEIRGLNVATCYISAPKKPCQSLGIKLPFLVIVVKNINLPMSIEVKVKDDKDQPRRFRVSNYQSKMRVSNFSSNLPLVLNSGWNQIILNLAEFTFKAYQTNYMETTSITVNANCRLKNIYFSDRLYAEDEKPKELRWTGPIQDRNPPPVKQGWMVGTKMREPILPSPARPAPPAPPLQELKQEEEQHEMKEHIKTEHDFHEIMPLQDSDDTKRPPSQATLNPEDDSKTI